MRDEEYAHPGRRGGMQQSSHFAVTAGDEASTTVMQKDQAVCVHIRRSGFAEMQPKNRPHDPHDQERSLQTGRAQGTPYGHLEDGYARVWARAMDWCCESWRHEPCTARVLAC